MILKFRDSYTEARLKPQFLEAFFHINLVGGGERGGSLGSVLCSLRALSPEISEDAWD